jgi:hypothetical protein
VPLYLLWLFVSWSVIIKGAEDEFLLGNNNYSQNKKKHPRNVPNTLDQASIDLANFNQVHHDNKEVEQTVPLFNFQEQAIVLAVINFMEQKQIKGEGAKINQLSSLFNGEVEEDELDVLLEKLIGQKILIKQPNGEYFLIRNLEKYSLIEFIRC